MYLQRMTLITINRKKGPELMAIIIKMISMRMFDRRIVLEFTMCQRVNTCDFVISWSPVNGIPRSVKL
jgi:hypothetical protein